MRIKVHPGLCNGWGECHRWGREVYPLDDDGMCEMRLLEVPPEMEDHARFGAMACPEQAITVIDDDPDAQRRFWAHLEGGAGETPVRLAGRSAVVGS
jgi:ferredoxin